MSGRNLRVLYVDDEEALGILVPLAMAPLGYHVDYFESPRAGLEDFRRRPGEFDAVVTDLSMPDGNGLEVLRAVRKLLPGTPVILLTAYASVPTTVEAMRLGAVTLLEKPAGVLAMEAFRRSVYRSGALLLTPMLRVGEASPTRATSTMGVVSTCGVARR